jgi:hypothetical protein
MKAYLELLLAETSTSSDALSPAQQTDIINEGCLIFAMETNIVRAATPYKEITLNTGDAGYDLDSTFLDVVEGVFLYTAAGVYVRELDPVDGGYKTFITNNSSAGQPCEYTVMGITKASDTASPVERIVVDPPPSATYDEYLLRVYHAKQPLVLSGATDVSDIPIPYHRGPICLAAAIAKERDQEFDQAKYYQSKADYWIKRAKRNQFRRDRTLTGWKFAEGQYVNR